MVVVLSPTSGVMVVQCFLQKSGNTLKRSQPETARERCAHLAEKLTDQAVSQVDVYSEESVLKQNRANQRIEYVHHREGCSGIDVKVPRTESLAMLVWVNACRDEVQSTDCGN